MSWTLVAAAGLSCLFYRLLAYIWGTYVNHPLRYVPGPPNPSYLLGNIKQIVQDNSRTIAEWLEQYGKTIKFTGLAGDPRLVTLDTRAINHILMNSFTYQKPAATTWSLSRVVGNGVLVVEGEKHRQQRRIMNPAFGPNQIRELTDIFVEKAAQLRDLWASECSRSGGSARIDALTWLSRMTLDVIGEAGFHYQFGNLNDGPPSELNEAFTVAFEATTSQSLIPFLQARFPIFRVLPFETAREAIIRDAHVTMNRIGRQLLDDSKAALNGTGEKGDNWMARDLLSLLVRANMSKDLNENQKMSDADVLSQISTMMVAGHETTSTGTTWALFALTQYPHVQSKLREELLSVATDTPSMDELNALTYLDWVVRETLRLYAPAPVTIRVAVQDDVIPLNVPYTDTRGEVHDEIRVKKGQNVIIPILALNKDKDLWGDDAHEFKPERWDSPPEAITSIPGVWGNMLTFLGGPRSCIGYRFSLMEMKALLFVLLRAFEFELAVPREDIGMKSRIVQRPILKPDGRNEMPLLVKPAQA